MTIEQKAKRYDETLEQLKGLIEVTREDKCDIGEEDIIDIFPELKESEDEEIRKSIVKILTKIVVDTNYRALGIDFSIENMIAWLEKQGEQNLSARQYLVSKGYPVNTSGDIPTYEELYEIIKEGIMDANEIEPKFKVGDYIERKDGLGCHAKIIFVGGNVYGCEKLIHSEDDSPFFDLMFKNQDEFQISSDFKQNLADKVEPKFKVGDWVVKGDTIAQILDIQEQYYVGLDINGKDFTSSRFLNDDKIHLWTIQDAKDGDVLVYRNTATEIIMLFKSWVVDREAAYTHFHIFDNNCRVNDSCDCGYGAHPATKEQRDLLFQKMKESGYEWDDDKKELKKIEDGEYNGEDYGIDSLFHAQRILEKTLGKVDGYQTDDGILAHQCAISAVKKLYEQKPSEWSEEDEHRINDIIYFLETAKKHYASTVELDACIDWLESLK